MKSRQNKSLIKYIKAPDVFIKTIINTLIRYIKHSQSALRDYRNVFQATGGFHFHLRLSGVRRTKRDKIRQE